MNDKFKFEMMMILSIMFTKHYIPERGKVQIR